MKSLYVFTYQYPYATRESFVGDELVYLSTQFDRVYVVPEIGCKGDSVRSMPDNCELLSPERKQVNRLSRYVLGFFSFRTVGLAIRDFFNNSVYKDRLKLRNWISYLLMVNNMLHDSRCAGIKRQLNDGDVCYFYWGVGRNALSIFWHKRARMVSRFHGDWDLWEESYHGYVPFRDEVVRSLDAAVFISRKGERYFKSKHPQCRGFVFPLGSKDCGVVPSRTGDGVIRVISCSAVYDVKRVDLIFRSLNGMMSDNIEWTHIGDGVDFDVLKELVDREMGAHLTVNLIGRIPHEEVLEYYKTHHFDLFMNLSTNEGVPVAIMEASSFGIPVVATNVGSTSDIVTGDVGELVSPNPTTEEVCDAIHKVMGGGYNPRNFWMSHYNAEVNYSAFAKMLSSL